MNKYEFEEKLIDVQELIEEGRYQEAVNECENLNLDLLTKPRVLNQIARAYEKCRRYEDAEILLLQAREYASKSRGILFHLCNVAIRAGDLEGAEEYYEDFCRLAPRDIQRYVLQYRLSYAKGRPDEELIEILEIIRRDEPNDHWLYILAQYYVRAGRTDDAVAVCDEIDLWFDNGKYVYRAAELKSELTGIPLEELLPEKAPEEEPAAEETIGEEAEEESAGGETAGEESVEEEAEEESVGEETEEESAGEKPAGNEPSGEEADTEPEEEAAVEDPAAKEPDTEPKEPVFEEGESLPETEADETETAGLKEEASSEEESAEEEQEPENVLSGVEAAAFRFGEISEKMAEEEAEKETDAAAGPEDTTEAGDGEVLKQLFDEEAEADEHVVISVTSVDQERLTTQAAEVTEEEASGWWRDAVTAAKEAGEEEEERRAAAAEKIEELAEEIRIEEEEKDEPEITILPMESRSEDELLKRFSSRNESARFGYLPINPVVTKKIWHFIIYAENHTLAEECAREVMRDISLENPGVSLTKAKLLAGRVGRASIVNSLDHFLGKMTIIEDASLLSDSQLEEFTKVLDKDDRSLLIGFTDTKENILSLFERLPALSESFTAVFDGKPVTAEELTDNIKDRLYEEEAVLSEDAEALVLHKAGALLAEKKGRYLGVLAEYVEKAREKAEKGGFLGIGAGKTDENGLLIIDSKHFRGLE